MVGDGMMIAPVYIQNAKGRYVYLPEEMLMVQMSSLEERTCRVMEKGHHFVEIALNELVIFVKKDHMLPVAVLGEQVRTTKDLENAEYEWLGFVETEAEYLWYQDDGISKDYVEEKEWERVVRTREDFKDGFWIKG